MMKVEQQQVWIMFLRGSNEVALVHPSALPVTTDHPHAAEGEAEEGNAWATHHDSVSHIKLVKVHDNRLARRISARVIIIGGGGEGQPKIYWSSYSNAYESSIALASLLSLRLDLHLIQVKDLSFSPYRISYFINRVPVSS